MADSLGTWTIWRSHDHPFDKVEVIAITEDGPAVVMDEVAIAFEYADTTERIFPWASIREARWEPAESNN